MAKTLLSIVIIFVMIQFISKNSYSVEPEEFLQNPKQEMRARNISKNIRCSIPACTSGSGCYGIL